MDLLSSFWSWWREEAIDAPFCVVACFAKLALIILLPVILCALARKAGRESEKANSGLAIFGAMVGMAWPLSPENWGDPGRINCWFLPVAAFSLIVGPPALAKFLADEYERQIRILGSLWLTILATLGLNMIIR